MVMRESQCWHPNFQCLGPTVWQKTHACVMHAASCLQAKVEAAQSLAEQLEKLKAEHEARLAALQEKVELQTQREAQREASRAAAENKVRTRHSPSCLVLSLIDGILCPSFPLPNLTSSSRGDTPKRLE